MISFQIKNRSVMGRNKYIQCSTCLKSIRSDHMKFHMHSKDVKYKMKICPICKKLMILTNLARHMKIRAKQSKAEWINEIKTDQVKNKECLEKGLFITEYIKEQNIDANILRREYREAMKTKLPTPQVEVILRPWQERLVEVMKPSEREIIWIVDPAGNEGKSWFQKYLKDIHGLRVFDANIRRSSKCILHILSKEIVSLIDIFLFNVPRSFNMDEFPYEMLEELKDGKAESIKYNSIKLQVNTPNTVLVFSNENPDKERMSKDRWIIYLIGVGVLLHSNGYIRFNRIIVLL